jgi:hypothetical protein
MAAIQDDLGVTVNMLEGDSIGHFEKRMFISACV